jgi:2-oxoglutarate dehydrogenase complex dehydrogenase (E1) component-like enzyme
MKQSIKDAEERDWLSLQLEQTRTKADKYCEENRVLSKELADARMKGD